MANVECADLELISDSYESLYNLHSTCYDIRHTINYKKMHLLVVLPKGVAHRTFPIVLRPDCDLSDAVSSFQFIGSTVSSNWTL